MARIIGAPVSNSLAPEVDLSGVAEDGVLGGGG